MNFSSQPTLAVMSILCACRYYMLAAVSNERRQKDLGTVTECRFSELDCLTVAILATLCSNLRTTQQGFTCVGLSVRECVCMRVNQT